MDLFDTRVYHRDGNIFTLKYKRTDNQAEKPKILSRNLFEIFTRIDGPKKVKILFTPTEGKIGLS